MWECPYCGERTRSECIDHAGERKIGCYLRELTKLKKQRKAMYEWIEALQDPNPMRTDGKINNYLKRNGWQVGKYGHWKKEGKDGEYAFFAAMLSEAKAILSKVRGE